jgi:hypothetical protein
MEWQKFEDLDPTKHEEVDLFVVYRGVGDRFTKCRFVQPYTRHWPNKQKKSWCHLEPVDYDGDMGWDVVGGGEAVITHFLVVENPE